MDRLQTGVVKGIAAAALLGMISQLIGCELDSYFDASKTGYFERTPISTPILERLDVIEPDGDPWANTTPPTAADLLPSHLEYRLVAGDVITVEVLDLVLKGTVSSSVRQIDQAGNVRLPPPLRDFPAAGLTLAELEDEIVFYLKTEPLILDPFVSVNLNTGQGFSYTVIGQVPGPNVYPLRRPDLQLTAALAMAGGAAVTTETILVIRPVPLSKEIREPFDRSRTEPPGDQQPPPNIEDILDQLDQNKDRPAGGGDGMNLGVLHRDPDPPIDIDAFRSDEPRRIGDFPSDLSTIRRTAYAEPSPRSRFEWIAERNEWVAVQDDGQEGIAGEVLPGGEERLVLERIIEIPYRKLLSDSSYNIVVRPGDRIFVQPPLLGVVYIEGEVVRPGVYSLPAMGRLTLSRLVAAAGGLGAIAVPRRVDLIRRTGSNREATIRLSLTAIRHRNEPDIFLKPDDHIIIGTDFWATPVAIIRNGFRATYGFGFLLDRNFGNDVFGAPPSNVGRGGR